MAEPILIRALGPTTCQWLDLAASGSAVQTGDLDTLAAIADNRSLILLWPADSVLLLEIELPLRQAAQINKALPFVLEEWLAEDVEQYHWVWQRLPGSSKLAVAVVGQAMMSAYRQRFEVAGIQISMALPEPLLLPWQAEQLSWLVHNGQGVFRYAHGLGGGGEATLCQMLLQKLPHTTQTASEWHVWSAPEQAEALEWVGESWTNHRQHVLDEPLMLYAGQWQAAKSMNLFSGLYAPKARHTPSVTAWWPAAAIGLLALTMQCVGQWHLAQQQQQQLQVLQASNEALFKQTFPDIKRLVNLKAQADQQLTDLQQHNQIQQTGFLALLYQTGLQLKQQPQLSLQRLQFVNERLQLRVVATDPAAIEQLQAQWHQADGLQVELTGTKPGPKGEEADFVIQHR
ncbi:MAG: hypothetical protein CTY19_17040 [Methylomonas sp.]|nr:MAG: hypothetical protein CTY19_17040 [Methylomonas sp.]